MKTRVIKDVTTGLYFKSNPSGWEGEWLKADRIVWAKTAKTAGRYSMSANDDEAIQGVIDCFTNLFPGHEFVVEVYERNTVWILIKE